MKLILNDNDPDRLVFEVEISGDEFDANPLAFQAASNLELRGITDDTPFEQSWPALVRFVETYQKLKDKALTQVEPANDNTPVERLDVV